MISLGQTRALSIFTNHLKALYCDVDVSFTTLTLEIPSTKTRKRASRTASVNPLHTTFTVGAGLLVGMPVGSGLIVGASVGLKFGVFVGRKDGAVEG